MSELISFLLEPYQTTSAFHIVLEIIGAAFGIASVFFAKKRKYLGFIQQELSVQPPMYIFYLTGRYMETSSLIFITP
jgi:nicotinamide mononucleotide transporter